MSSTFFKCTARVSLIKDEGLREDAKNLLQRTRTIRASEMMQLYSKNGEFTTSAALEWSEYNMFGVGEVYFWRGTDMSPRLYDALVEDLLEDNCIIKAARLPCVHEYIKTPCLAFAGGSHLYDIADGHSDWDGVVLTYGHQSLKTDDSEPFFRIYTPGLLFQDARRGLRHAWELLTAPASAQMTWDTNLEEIRQKAFQTLSKTKIPWRDGSREYFSTWYPRFFINPSFEADPSIKRWKMQKGWPYKLGYYLFIDTYLSLLAEKSGKYQTIITDSEIASILCRMKQGEMSLQEWMDLITHLLPPGCSLKDGEGKIPVEFERSEV